MNTSFRLFAISSSIVTVAFTVILLTGCSQERYEDSKWNEGASSAESIESGTTLPSAFGTTLPSARGTTLPSGRGTTLP